MQVSRDHVIAFRYVMKNAHGEILENTLEAAPTLYLHGGGTIDAGLQLQMEGLKRGDKKTIFLRPGDESSEVRFEVIIDEVRQGNPQELLLGYPVQVEVAKCGDDCDCYD